MANQGTAILNLDRRGKRWAFHLAQGLCFAALGVALCVETFAAAWGTLVLAVALCLNLGMWITSVVIGGRAVKELTSRLALLEQVKSAHEQIEEMFAMTDMLQAADGHDDASAVLMATAQRLLPAFGGALYVFNNSRDRLDLASSWNLTIGFDPPQSIAPSGCWALKRGKAHTNNGTRISLACTHAVGTAPTAEVPMMARGQVFGLLMLSIDGEHACERLNEARRITRSLADAMSLALSSIALQEKLRTQSLHDPLTGLYNRRYMQDALNRYIDLAARSGSPTAVIMIDLDNFKRLNDEFGHAKGDAVLRDVAAQLVGALRPADVVARYGGEELLVILPNCTLADAVGKADVLRERILGLSEPHGTLISGSFGVAAVPESATGSVEVVEKADAALYVAKHAGKNCVRSAAPRADRGDTAPRLVTA